MKSAKSSDVLCTLQTYCAKSGKRKAEWIVSAFMSIHVMVRLVIARFDRVEECNSMTLTPFPANCLAEHHFPSLQKHGAWTGTGFVCADDLPLSDDEDEEQAAFNSFASASLKLQLLACSRTG